MAAAPRVLVSWYYPDQIFFPPPILSPNQVTIGPAHTDPTKMTGRHDAFSAQYYDDIGAVLDRAGIDKRFDLVVAFGATGFNEMYNLGCFSCPKILGVADTHHDLFDGGPIRPMINLALTEPFDGVFSLCDHQHLHFFADAGIKNIAYFPGIQHEALDHPEPLLDQRQVAFIGHVNSRFHMRRARLLMAMQKAGYVLVGGGGIARPHIPAFYARALTSFNCSLNNDVNTRVFEIIGAGGLMVTDRLSAQSGMDALFEEGVHYLAFRDEAELLDVLGRVFAEPDHARRIAAAGHAHYKNVHTPERKARDLLRWALEGDLDPLYRVRDHRAGTWPGGLRRRTEFYERIQMTHLKREWTRLLVLGDTPPVHVADILDLPRLDVAVLTPGPEMAAMLDRHDVAARVRRLDAAAAAASPWDAVVGRNDASFDGVLLGDS